LLQSLCLLLVPAFHLLFSWLVNSSPRHLLVFPLLLLFQLPLLLILLGVEFFLLLLVPAILFFIAGIWLFPLGTLRQVPHVSGSGRTWNVPHISARCALAWLSAIWPLWPVVAASPFGPHHFTVPESTGLGSCRHFWLPAIH